MHDARSAIERWISAGALPRERFADALRVAGITPMGAQWIVFIERVLTWLGAIAIAAAAACFIGANWQAFGRFAKFSFVEVGLVAALALACWRGLDVPLGRAALFVAALLTGGTLALVGQVYQTGADTFELFAIWAAAILVWVVAGRQPALWLLWLALVDVAIVLYFRTSVARGIVLAELLFAPRPALWLVIGLDAAALAIWEVVGATRGGWPATRWAPRALATVCGALLTLVVVHDVMRFGHGDPGWSWVPFALWIAALYWAYRIRTRDLFMLAGMVLCVVVVVAFVLSRPALEAGGAVGFLLIGLVVIVCTAAGSYWLRQVAAERESA